MDATDKLLKQLQTPVMATPIASSGMNDFILPNTSGKRQDVLIGSCKWVESGEVLYLKNSAGTNILSIDLTTGNMTLGGSQKRVICTKVVGV